MKRASLSMGLDIGSTTAKAVIMNGFERLYSNYTRHNGDIRTTLLGMITKAREKIGDNRVRLSITGSAGMGLSEKLDIPFVQELIASSEYVTRLHPEVRTIIDIGGEDSKIIFLNRQNGHDMRMNGSCAGGTGAFIDQMAALLQIPIEKLNSLAGKYKNIFPIASRCGVFAKTDVQNLLSREIPKPDIAASVFYSVALQIKNSLMRGYDTMPGIIYSGGPLTFLDILRNHVSNIFNVNNGDLVHMDSPHLLPASGAAILEERKGLDISFSEFEKRIISNRKTNGTSKKTIGPLFKNDQDFKKWDKKQKRIKAARVGIENIDGKECFLGIDSGSTTSKIVLIDNQGRIAYDYYCNNAGNPIQAVKNGISELKSLLDEKNVSPKICRTAVTGYGEDLIKAAFDLDYGIVETMAHFKAAAVFDPEVSFILDIGGQDMKAIFVKDSIIRNIEINEACSSGCGTFIETFAESLDYTVDEFAKIACSSSQPCELGTRCTVFMNSKVKQSFREGASVSDISAGLAYSVIRNCLHKVLRIHDPAVLGDNIIVQGGTFKNPAIQRAIELELGKKVSCPDISELMGAYGAALNAREMYNEGAAALGSFSIDMDLKTLGTYTTRSIQCKGCENQCKVSRLNFGSGNDYFTGNRCEKMFTNRGTKLKRGFDLPEYKSKLLFDRPLKPEGEIVATLGIPRVLNFFENFPFWAKLLTECGFEIVLSDRSTNTLCDKGAGTVMSDNICFPAKLTHGHIFDLIEKGVDRIFFPFITYEQDDIPGATNSFNCPVVSGYPQVVDNVLGHEDKKVILDDPTISFNNEKLTRKTIYNYLAGFGIKKKDFNRAFKLANQEKDLFKAKLVDKAKEILVKAREENRKVIVLAGRPYHIDNLINHNTPEMITDYGLDVLTEDSLPYDNDSIDDVQVLTQWNYPNRMYRAAKWVLKHNEAEFVQLNSFGCGPDSIAIDELKDILSSGGRNYTLIRIDEHTADGSLRLRIRSLVESIKLKNDNGCLLDHEERMTTRPFNEDDKDKEIIVPFFSPFHSSYITSTFATMGYHLTQLPPSDEETIKLGLQYVNNEICYPATLVIGDIIKALKSGKYDLSKTGVGLTQTGGQCRASNYVPLLKKALVRAGFKDVPVIGASVASQTLNYQPGFKLDRMKLIKLGALGILYGDCLSQMYYSSVVREKNKGESLRLADKYSALADEGVKNGDKKFLLNTLKKAVEEFNEVEIVVEKVPKIGIVGEIYVKYNPIGNNHIVEHLIKEGVEVVMPPLINMFSQWFVNVGVKRELLSEDEFWGTKLAFFLEKYYNKVHKQFDDTLRGYRYYFPQHGIRDIAGYASEVMNLINLYFGEGWLIAGDTIAFAESGVKDVLCLQPFGCIANHIVARGVEKSIRERNPDLNILFLDIDSGTSEVNLHNRLHLLLKHARENIS